MSNSDFYDRLKKSTPPSMPKQSPLELSRALTEPAIKRVSSLRPPSAPSSFPPSTLAPSSPRHDPRVELENDDPKTPPFRVNYLEEANKIWDTSDMVCYHNGSGDVIIRNKRSNVECKISSGLQSLNISVSASNVMEPTLHHGLSAMKITKRS